MGVLVSTAVVALAATSATAAAETFCIGPPGSAVTSARADGGCSNPDATAKTLVEQSEATALQGEITKLERNVSALEKALTAVQTKLSPVIYDATGENGLPTLRIVGNLQIVNGTGTTDGTVNGLGNLFIGYNEHFCCDRQTGSHNLIIGMSHSFTSYGGLIAGDGNTITNASSFLAGSGNLASGFGSSVSGGMSNTASGFGSSVSGGAQNTASVGQSSVSGGELNTAGGLRSSVSGGFFNRALGHKSSILGGFNNEVAAIEGTSP